jgi:hypothetical protein
MPPKKFNPIKNLKHFAHPARLPTGTKIGRMSTTVKKTRAEAKSAKIKPSKEIY